MEKKVSIIVPVYNSEKYLKECLDSLTGQTLSDLEIILVNDASTDKSYNIMLEYEQLYPGLVQVYSFQQNSKQGAARNLGIRMAKGKYLLFVDSDDVLELRACELLYNRAEAMQADIVFCDYIMFSEEDERYCQHVQNVYLGNMTVEKKKALLTTSVVPWAKLFLKSLVVDNNIFFPEKVFYEDQATTYLYYLYAKKAAKVESALYKYRVTDYSTSGKKNTKRHFQQTDMAIELVRRMEKRGFSQIYREEIDFFLIEQMYCLGVEICFQKFDDPSKEQLQKLLVCLNLLCPNYRKNIYYREYISEYYKKILEVHQVSVEELICEFQKGEFKKYCPNYTWQIKKCQEKIKEMVVFFKKNKIRTLLWGAGKYSKYILECFEAIGYRFDYLADRNSSLWGKKYGEYTIVPTTKVGEVDVAVIEYTNFYHDISEEIRAMKIKVKIVDLEIYIKHNLGLPFEQYLERIG